MTKRYAYLVKNLDNNEKTIVVSTSIGDAQQIAGFLHAEVSPITNEKTYYERKKGIHKLFLGVPNK